jgi:hypothetical protein
LGLFFFLLMVITRGIIKCHMEGQSSGNTINKDVT